MRKHIFTAILVACGMSAHAQGSLNIGNYDEIEEWDSPTSNLYEGSYWEVAPINFYLTNSGTQIILQKEQVADLAGQDITGLNLKYYCEGAYVEGDVHLTITLTEANRDDFFRDSENKNRYRCFDISCGSAAFDDDINIDTYSYDSMCGEVTLPFSHPFHYSGENNLVMTISATGISDTTDGGFYVNFFYAEGLDKQALVWASDKKTWDEVLSGSDGEDLYLPAFGVSTINAPVMQLTYESGDAPASTWQSYVPTRNEDLDFAEGTFDAYKVTDFSSEGVQIERVTKAKKGEPLVVRSRIVPSISPATGATAQADNLLQLSDGSVTSDGTLYCLAKKNGVYGFYRMEEGVRVPEGKVYLQVTSAANDFIAFSGETTGIHGVATEHKTSTDDYYYTLQGQRVVRPAQGVYIHQGKKVVIK